MSIARYLVRFAVLLVIGAVLSVVVAALLALYGRATVVQRPVLAMGPFSFALPVFDLGDGSRQQAVGWGLTISVQIEEAEPPPAADDPDLRLRGEATVVYRTGWPFRVLHGRKAWTWLMNRFGTRAKGPPYPRTTMFGLVPTSLGAAQPAWVSVTLPGDAARVLPYHVHWGGLLGNAVLYAMALGVILATPRALVRRMRAARGRCRSCGYILRAICPECGRRAT